MQSFYREGLFSAFPVRCFLIDLAYRRALVIVTILSKIFLDPFALFTCAMAVFSDQCGNSINLPKAPERIVSLVPSQTELLYYLHVGETVTGITRYCVHPTHWREQKQIVGGTKKFDFDVIDKINPDLIIGNKEENYREGIERLQKNYPVWLSDIYNLPDALAMITTVGRLVNAELVADKLVTEIQGKFNGIRLSKPRRALYLIWRKPWMVAAAQTFIDDMLNRIGLVNCARHLTRYPALSDDEIGELNPDYILLSSEPYPFKEKHCNEIQQLSPNSRILLVDGEMFSWYGSRLARAPVYFNSLPLFQD